MKSGHQFNQLVSKDRERASENGLVGEKISSFVHDYDGYRTGQDSWVYFINIKLSKHTSLDFRPVYIIYMPAVINLCVERSQYVHSTITFNGY